MSISLETPDGTTLPMPSIEEHRKGNAQVVDSRAEQTAGPVHDGPSCLLGRLLRFKFMAAPKAGVAVI